MTDAIFFLLDGLLNAAKGMLYTNRAKVVQEQYGLKEDPRGSLSKIFTSPLGAVMAGLVSTYFINRDIVGNAKTKAGEGRYFRNF